MFKTKRRKELEAKERELAFLKMKISEMETWCACDSPEIGFAMRYLAGLDKDAGFISNFRDRLRGGKLTFYKYKEANQ